VLGESLNPAFRAARGIAYEAIDIQPRLGLGSELFQRLIALLKAQ